MAALYQWGGSRPTGFSYNPGDPKPSRSQFSGDELGLYQQARAAWNRAQAQQPQTPTQQPGTQAPVGTQTPLQQLQAAMPSVPPSQDPVQQKAAAEMDPMNLIRAYQQMAPMFNLWNPGATQAAMYRTAPFFPSSQGFGAQMMPYLGLLSLLRQGQQAQPMQGAVPQGALGQIGPAIFNSGLVPQRPPQQFPVGVTPQVPQRSGNDYGGVWDYLYGGRQL